MNDKPHTHALVLQHRYPSLRKGDWFIEYGDTTARVCAWWRIPKPRQVLRAGRRVIRKHDSGSQPKPEVSFEAVVETLATLESDWGGKPFSVTARH